MNKLSKSIELAVNLAIILVAILISIIFVKNYLLAPQSAPESVDYRIPAGTKVSLPEVDWAQNGQTLLLVLKKGCRYCARARPSINVWCVRRLHRTGCAWSLCCRRKVRGKQYLSSLDVPISEVRRAELGELGVRGTPTLILVNGKGEVMESWAGKLLAEKKRKY